MSQTDRDCGGTQTHGQTDRPARLLLPPQLRQETSLGSESARHVQPDLTGRTPAAFRGCRTDGLSFSHQEPSQLGSVAEPGEFRAFCPCL